MGIVEIAKALQRSKSYIGTEACKVYRQEMVKNLKEFRERFCEKREKMTAEQGQGYRATTSSTASQALR